MNLQKYSLFIFDFDGTISDTTNAVVSCIKKTVYQFYEKKISEAIIDDVISKGIGLEEAFEELVLFLNLSPTDEMINKLVSKYRNIYSNESMNYVTLYPGIKEFMNSLYDSDRTVIVISNKGIEAIKYSLNYFGLVDFVDYVIGGDSIYKKKPDPMIFNEVIKNKYFDIENRNMLMIGDTLADIQFAKNCSIDSCWAAYGYGKEEECLNASPNYIVRDSQYFECL